MVILSSLTFIFLIFILFPHRFPSHLPLADFGPYNMIMFAGTSHKGSICYRVKYFSMQNVSMINDFAKNKNFRLYFPVFGP